MQVAQYPTDLCDVEPTAWLLAKLAASILHDLVQGVLDMLTFLVQERSDHQLSGTIILQFLRPDVLEQRGSEKHLPNPYQTAPPDIRVIALAD